ncbi:phosphoglycerate mutase-like protein [Coemansia reversa NRRL 1564]|uniref:Phosphoglycerate mutase-like protein n=1 Tax=Coemansia reversa (strain ATCC 12441 / NRRL 1564) TaxID=763665 RepID=A0A2G5BFA4_COERN|nr:phosphoglycerate mutase-like protein [Coemansia reversa NRRL 1564]|eukprot:PIA17698.1 phosphoglycerate mutase-like protein [Coemansia reversa NRRL 1564]
MIWFRSTTEAPTKPNFSEAAPLPELTPDYIKKMYPSYLKLIQTQVLFRHGERAPMMSKLFPDERWLFCYETNRLHSEFMKAVNLFEPLGKKVTLESSDSASRDKIQYEPAFWGIRVVEKPKQKANTEESWDPRSCHMGQLSDIGLSTLYHSGAFLRILYVDKLKFIPQKPEGNLNNWLYIRTTDYSRVIQSTYALLTGMYPGYPKQQKNLMSDKYVWPVFGKEFLRQFPIHTRDILKDPLNLASRSSEYHDMINDVTIEETRKVKWLDDIYRQTIRVPSIGPKAKELMNHVGVGSNFHHLFDELMSSKAHGIPPPSGISSEHMDNIHAASYYQWMTIPQTTRGQRMGYGELISNLAQTMAQAASAADNSTDDWPLIGSQRTHDLLLSHDGGLRKVFDHEISRVPRMALYGTHDVTIGTIATILGSTRKTWPMFGSLMTIELFKDTTTSLKEVQHSLPVPSTIEQPLKTEGYFVRVRLDNEIIKVPTCQVQGKHHPKMGSTVCSLAAFYEHIESIVE